MDLLHQMMLTSGAYTPRDMFKAVTYVGTGTERSITGLGFKPDFVWVKNRAATDSHQLTDIVRGVTKNLSSDATTAEGTDTQGVMSFDSDGFTIGTDVSYNTVGEIYVAWCWKAGNTSGESNTNGSITSTVNAGKAFSIVKYTGTGANATVGHGLPSAPKLIIVKNLDAADAWKVYNETIDETDYLVLNTTAATADLNTVWNDTAPTSSVFSIGTHTDVNTNTEDYIAYCFADLPAVSKIGSYTGTGAVDNVVACGFQPAYVMIKQTNTVSPWRIFDNKRDAHNPNKQELYPNTSAIEVTSANNWIDLTATGFTLQATGTETNASGGTYIFMAFAELPTKDSPENHDVPLFNMIGYEGDGTAEHNIDGLGFKPDKIDIKNRDAADSHQGFDALRGTGLSLVSNTTAAQLSDLDTLRGFNADGMTLGNDVKVNTNAEDYIAHCFNAGGEAVPNTEGSIESTVMANAENGFSIVKYTGTGANATIGHGLDEAPEMIIVKHTSAAGNSWIVYHVDTDATAPEDYRMILNTTAARLPYSAYWNDTAPTDAVFSIGSGDAVNLATASHIAYCFHSVAGVSKFGTYDGTGAELSLTGWGIKPDYIRIKRTDVAGSWYVFDVKRGVTKYLLSDTTGVEATNVESLKSFDADGITLGTLAGVNASGGTFIYEAFKIQDNPNTLHQVETGNLLLSDSLTDDNGTHTVTNNGVTLSSTDPACGSNSLVFDGSSHLTVADSDVWDFADGDFTIEYWEYRTAGTARGIPLSRSALTYPPFMTGFHTSGTDLKFYATSTGPSWDLANAKSMGDYVLDTWIHYAVTRSGDTWRTYQNGILQDEWEASGSILTSTSDLYIGHRLESYFPGRLDHIRMLKGTALFTTTNFNLTDKGLYYPSGTLNV